MAYIDLRGMGVALVTPFKQDSSVDYEALARLIDFQIENKTDYLVLLGTTSEVPTLSQSERKEVITFTIEKVAGRVPIILGYGGNNTAKVIQDIKQTDFSGISALLSVVPYYSRPTQEGLYQHYAAISNASTCPIILYNVPGRCGVNLSAETTLRLASDCDNIIGIKEASGNVEQISTILSKKPANFQVISGDDSITLPLMTLGAVGVISVIGNALPAEFNQMVKYAMAGESEKALLIHNQVVPIVDALFEEGNPAGIKAMLHIMGLIENELRLPLVPVSNIVYQKIKQLYTAYR